VACAAALLTLAGCSSTPTSAGSTTVPSSNTNVATPDMQATKAAAGIKDCPAPQTTNGGLPHMTLKCLGGGRDVDLSTLKGPLVINVFQSACPPCIKEAPALGAFYKEYGAQYPMLGIDGADTFPGVALKEAKAAGITYPLIADPGGDLGGTSLSYNAYPTWYFLHADGTLTTARGGHDSVADILAMVQEQFAPTKAGGQSVGSVVVQTLGGLAVLVGVGIGGYYLVRRRGRAAGFR
jgi:thiol-disulfide isomerase/thioredoxin